MHRALSRKADLRHSGIPIVTGQELTERLLEQIKPFHANFHFGEMAVALAKLGDGRWQLTTDAGTVLTAPVIVIAAGGGSFVPSVRRFRASRPMRANRSSMRAQDGAVSRERCADRGRWGFGAGLDAQSRAHREASDIGASPRRIPRRAAQRQRHARTGRGGKVDFHVASVKALHGENGQLQAVTLASPDKKEWSHDTNAFLPFFGLTIKLGPIADFGLNLHENLIPVDTAKFESSTPAFSPSATSTPIPAS